jgi:tRNA1Val (adenine37-N6)-methyltransferase
MKVGIDGVLLGVWTSVKNSANILDIGTGTGLIALMLAQRTNSIIDAIEIDPEAVKQAVENVRSSPWSDLIHVKQISLQEFAKTANKKYDLIVSNPPYFINSLKNQTTNRASARHTDTLTHEELIGNSLLLLKHTGRICIILPVNEGLKCIDFAEKNGLHCSKKVTVFPKPNAVAKRLLIEFCLIPVQKVTSELIIEAEERHHYSPEFTELAKDFYLKL